MWFRFGYYAQTNTYFLKMTNSFSINNRNEVQQLNMSGMVDSTLPGSSIDDTQANNACTHKRNQTSLFIYLLV